MAILTPESENRRGQDFQEPPGGVLWDERERELRCARLTCRIALNRRGRHTSLYSFLEEANRV